MTRPRLLLIPASSELEWVIRPQLEEWAEVVAALREICSELAF